MQGIELGWIGTGTHNVMHFKCQTIGYMGMYLPKPYQYQNLPKQKFNIDSYTNEMNVLDGSNIK